MEAEEENRTNIHKALDDVRNLMQDNSKNEIVNQNQDIISTDNVLELAGHEIHEFAPSQELELDDEVEYELPAYTINDNSEQMTQEETAKAPTEIIDPLNEVDASINTPHNNGLLVEDLVKELVKPYINSWLDQNLSSIVKEVVDKEVKKLMQRNKE